MKYEVMINILMRLLTARKVTARELSERYGACTRSIDRYIDELTVCGVPVEIKRGRYGGVFIADTYKLPSGYFTRGEYEATVNALKAMLSQVSDENLLSALEKVESRRKDERQGAAVCGNIIVDGGTWGNSRKFSDKMKVCEQAVDERKTLSIDYISRNGERTKREIDPHFLVFKQNVWYVYAYCHLKKEFRTFKIGRIKSAIFTGAVFKRAEITRDDIELDFTEARGEFIEVSLEISAESLPDAEDWLGIDNIRPAGNKFRADLSLPDDGVLVNKILGYGGAVKVLSPASLKERVKKTAEKIARG